jgi:CTP synthase (UTP-ammonia lyase)
MCVTAVDDQNDVRAVELDGHPFFVATLFQPEMQTSNPLVQAFVLACERRWQSLAKAAS